ncbi:MAG: hypothetical protein RR216_05065 [Pseudoflavonifractor sp.]
MPAELTAKAAAGLGITVHHQRMDNGELRFRLCCTDGSSYIRTEAGAESGWQNSHIHHVVHELNVVQSGTVVLVEGTPEHASVRVCRSEESYTSPLGLPHNCYFLPGTVVHTVKFGGVPGGSDWTAYPPLDPYCRSLDLPALLAAH